MRTEARVVPRQIDEAKARRRPATATLVVVGAVLLALLPFVGVRPFTITLLTEALIFAIWAMSLDLMTGYAGMLTFGHAAAFGLGGYAAGYFAREVTSDFFTSLLIAELVILLVALPIGFVATRLSGAAFAIVSLCIAQVFFQIAVAWRSVTEGMDGLVGVPLPTLLGATINTGTEFYLLTALIAVIVCLGLRRLVASPFGRTLGAIRLNEDRAAAIGINVRLHKWLVFVISWAIAGIGGTLMVFMKAGRRRCHCIGSSRETC
jgi:branched-chain amino acid transport system permease protein